MFYLTIIIVILTIQSSIIIADNPCEFQTGQGLINLTIVAKYDGTAAYPDQSSTYPSNYKYSYNPCQPFTEGSGCDNVAACQITTNGGYTYSLGIHNTAIWNDGSSSGGDPSITYTYNARTTHVTLECTPNQPYTFEAIGEVGLNTYRFRLKHKCACWDGCKYLPDTTTTTTTRTTETTSSTSHKPSTTKESTTTESRSTTAQTTPSATTNAARPNCNIISRGTVLIAILLVFIFVH